jgi:hypothetical protein
MLRLILFLCLSLCLIRCKIRKVKITTEQSLSARYFSSQGFCTTGIVLNSDHTYCFEWGCENHSNLNLGTWKQIGDSIYLMPIDNKNINFIKKQTIFGVKRDSIAFRVRDKLNHEVSFFPIISYPYNANFEFGKKSEFYFKDDSQFQTELERQNEINRLYSYNIGKKNENGYFMIRSKDMEFIEFGGISLLTNKKFLLKVDDIKGDTIDIQLTTNKEAMAHSDLKWYNMEHPIAYKLLDTILMNSNDTLIEKKGYFSKSH